MNQKQQLLVLTLRPASKVAIQEQTLHELVRIRPHDSAKSARIQEADSIRRLTRLTQRDGADPKGYPGTSR